MTKIVLANDINPKEDKRGDGEEGIDFRSTGEVSKRSSSLNTYGGDGDTLDWTPGSLADIVKK